jgi:hypothetical protein
MPVRVRHVSFAAMQDELPQPPTSPVSSAGSNTPVPDGKWEFVEVRINDGEYEASKDLAYIHMAHLVHSPFSLIHELLERQCGAPMVYFAASAQGINIVIFYSDSIREMLISLGHFDLGTNLVLFERYEEADNRVIAEYQWFAKVAVVDYPLEHCDHSRMVHVLSAVGNVCCIDLGCLVSGDYITVRGVLKINNVEDVPKKWWICNHSGPGTIAKVFLLRMWSEPSGANLSHFGLGENPPIHPDTASTVVPQLVVGAKAKTPPFARRLSLQSLVCQRQNGQGHPSLHSAPDEGLQ